MLFAVLAGIGGAKELVAEAMEQIAKRKTAHPDAIE